ncbi:MAG: hypothetical protein AAGB51_11315 [Planctomycetota bacterium]
MKPRRIGDAHGGPTPLLLRSAATARLLEISTRRLWELTQIEAIPVEHIGRSVRYRMDLVSAWVAAGCPTTPGAAATIRRQAKGGAA